MATIDTPMADAPAQRRVNGSPLPPPSKRDKRRQMLTDRLAALSDKITMDRDKKFREQLSKIQIDTTLVSRVDPYVDRPLDSFEQDQAKLRNADGDAPSAQHSVLEMAGPRLPEWMDKIHDLVEQRDFALAKYKVCLPARPISASSQR